MFTLYSVVYIISIKKIAVYSVVGHVVNNCDKMYTAYYLYEYYDII